MNKTPITKSLVLSHRQCAKRAWLEASGAAQPQLTMGEQAMLDQGQLVHQAGRSLFPDATRIRSDMLLADAALQTKRELVAGADVLLEAAFVAGSLGVRVDVLKRGVKGYRIIEIKSAGEVKDEYQDDVAIQWACLTEAGLSIEGAEVMHPSTAKVRPAGGTGAEVLVSEDITDAAYWRSMKVATWVSECAGTLAGPQPVCTPGEQCSSPNPCPFISHCGKPVENLDVDLVDYLPSKASPVKELILSGITRISDLPLGAMKHERNALVRQAIVQNRAIVRADIADSIRALGFPRHFVDFEAASPAIPLFDDMRAHGAIVFQWSCHTQEGKGAALAHREFLDVSGNDPRRGFIESLLAAVGNTGPVLVYSSYEKTRLKELALLFADLSTQILALVDRIVDLLPLARRCYYHPDMRGSWSLKKIAPTLPACPDLEAYADMGDIADGLAAQAAYFEQINPAIIGPQKAARRAKMLTYCQADTRGLVHFVDSIEAAHDPVCNARADLVMA